MFFRWNPNVPWNHNKIWKPNIPNVPRYQISSQPEWHLHTRIADHQSSKASCFHDVLGNVSLSRLGSQILVVTDRSKRLSGLQMFSLKIVKNTCLYNNGSHVVNPVPIFWQMVSDMWRLAAFNPDLRETECQTDPLNLPSLSNCAANLMFLSCPSWINWSSETATIFPWWSSTKQLQSRNRQDLNKIESNGKILFRNENWQRLLRPWVWKRSGMKPLILLKMSVTPPLEQYQ